MTDYAQARRNMVDCQINTSGIIEPDILHAFSTVPREYFVPPHLQPVAYSDEDLHLPGGRVLIEPTALARMVQALELAPHEVVLDIGGNGYSAAILSSLATTVLALDDDAYLLESFSQLWQSCDLCNIATFSGPLTKGYPQQAPYDAVLLCGAVAEVPHAILQQLSEGGRLVTVIKKPGETMGKIMVFKRTGAVFSAYPRADAAVAYLRGFEPAEVFQF
jgi:protein-L-isoaspartate(D-aspartate) O-methyltransferase